MNHANREATSTCNGCAQRLCDACVFTLGGLAFCEGCAPEGSVSASHEQDYEALPVLNVTSMETERADFDSRFLAGVIDTAILGVGIGAIWGLVGSMLNSYRFPLGPRQGVLFYVFWLGCLALVVAYHTVFLSLRGQTIGKQQTGVMILTPDGKILSLGHAFKRSLASVLSGAVLGLGYLWLMWDRNQETWHDKIAGTAAYRYFDVN
jgi:uncharacterized RDD family membrane protein YckC